MRKDEYNHVEITNEKQLRGIEFGKAQSFEFSSYKDNYSPKGELNEKYLGKTIRKQTEVNVQYSNKIQLHGSTTVTSATTASNVAAGMASVATAASVVAVTAVAVATGVSVALHDYDCKFNSFIVTSNSLTYDLVIVDKGEKKDTNGVDYNNLAHFDKAKQNADNPDEHLEEEQQFTLRVYNNNYDYSIGAGCHRNYGTFTGLTLGESYHITLSESRYGGEVLYDETFTAHNNSVFNYFYVDGGVDNLNNTFDVYLDYIDELDILSNFTLKLSEVEKPQEVTTFNLEKQNGTQKVAFDANSFNPSGEYSYWFSYKKEESVIDYDQGTVTFYDLYEMKSEMYGVSFPKEADFLKRTFDLALDYEDDYDHFSNFTLTLSDNDISETFNLRKTTASQTVILPSDSEIDFAKTYNYVFKYEDDGEEKIIEQGEVTFTDISGAISEVEGVIFPKEADFFHRTFEVQLLFQDDFNYFSDFTLTLADAEYPEEVTETFNLIKINTKQTVTLPEESNIDFNRTYNYTFKYLNQGEEVVIEEGEVTFTDIGEAKSVVNGVTWDQKCNFLTYEMNLTLDYQDDYEYFSDFMFILHSEVLTGDAPEGLTLTYGLAKTTDEQIIHLDAESAFDLAITYDYEFTYLDRGETKVIDSGTVHFEDNSGLESKFNAFIFDKTANFITETFVVQLDYTDPFNVFSEFTLTFYDPEGTPEDGMAIPLDLVTTEQEISAQMFDIDLSRTYNYVLTVLESGVLTELDSGEVTFTDNSGGISEFHQFIFTGEADFLENTFNVQLDYQDDFNYFDNFVLILYQTTPEEDGIEVNLSKTTVEQVINCLEYDIMLSNLHYYYLLDCDENGVHTTLEMGQIDFSDTSGAVDSIEFRNMIFDYGVNYKTGQITVQLDYTDPLEWLYGFQLTITSTTDSDVTQTVDLSTTTESQLVELNSTLGWTNPDTKYNYNLRYYKLDEELHYTSNEPFSFYNSLTADAFGGVESPFDWVQSDNGDDWLLPIKFDYDKSTNVYDSLSADILIGTEVVGGLSFGDYSNNLSDWRYATYYSNGTYELSDVCSATNAKLRVSGFVVNSNLTNFSYTEVVYEEDVNFTTGSTSDLYGIFVLYDDITAGSYDIALLPIYTGTASGASCEIVFEALNENHRTYTCSLSYFTHDVENFTVVSLLNCEEYDTYTNNGEEYSLFEEYIDTDFGGGVKITLVYNMNNGAGEKTIVAYTSHIFIVQH